MHNSSSKTMDIQNFLSTEMFAVQFFIFVLHWNNFVMSIKIIIPMIAIKTVKPVAPMPFEDKRESCAQLSFRYVEDKAFLSTVRMLFIWSNLS